MRWSGGPRRFEHLDQAGDGSMLEGVYTGIEDGWFQGRIADAAYDLERRIQSGRRVVVGVNRFTEGSDVDELEILQITPEDEERQLKRLAEVRAERDQASVASALDRLRADAAETEVNLVPALVEAVKTYASLGEVTDALADVFGRYVEKPVL